MFHPITLGDIGDEAVCHRSDEAEVMTAYTRRMFTTLYGSTSGYSPGGFISGYQPTYTITDNPVPKKKRKHELAGTSCECGFYAYFDGANDYLRQGGGITASWDDDTAPRLGAIVEGWGVCTVGSRGFRASKARIVGLIAPTSQSARYTIAFAKVRANYGVQVFDTELDAITAHPLTDPFPADPTAEDFWTRSAR